MPVSRNARRGISANVPLTRLMIDLPLSVVFFVSLAISYRYLTFFLGYQYFDYIPEPLRLPMTGFLLLVTAVIMPAQKTIHGFAMCLFVYSLWLPLLVWYSFGGGSPKQVAITGFVMVALRLIGFIGFKRPVFAPVAPIWIIVATLICASFLALWALAANGIGSVNFLIYEVYAFRREAAAGLPRIFQYLWPQVANAMVPLAVALCLAQGRKISFALLCAISVFLFAVVHHKGILFTPFFAAIVFYLFHRRDDLNLFKIAFVAAAVVGATEAIIYEASNSEQLGTFNLLISRRVFLVPAQLDGMYLEYFSIHPQYFWSTSKLTFGLIEPPYEVTAPLVIGEAYFGRLGISSNTGMIGAGFANAGFLGVMVYVVIIGAVLCLLESHASVLGHAVVITASILIIHNAVTASDSVTLMLTGGFGSLLLLLSFIKGQGSGH